MKKKSRDTQRLDWLQRTSPPIGFVTIKGAVKTWRRVIDNAMKTEAIRSKNREA